MSEPPPTLPPSSNVMTYAVVTLVVIGAVGFLFLLFGEWFTCVLAPFGLLILFGALHYFVWGRTMSAGVERDTDLRSGSDDSAD